MREKKAVKEKKSKKPSNKKVSKLPDGNRLRKATRRPLFWILLAIIGVSIFGQISSSGNQFTKVDTSAVLAAISNNDVESAILVDREQLIRAILKPGKAINGATKVEASYVTRQEPLIVELLTSNPPPSNWNVKVPTTNILISILFSVGPILLIAFIIFSDKSLDGIQKKKVVVLFTVSFFVIFFWSAFEQAGASLTFFASENTQRDLGFYVVPTSFFQSLNSIFVVTLAPLVAWIWIKLGKAKREPSSPFKMAMGLMLLALGYLWIATGVNGVGTGVKVSMIWLIGMYMMHTFGELCLSPIGLSLFNKLAPLKFASLLMAVWFTANAFANKLAGVFSTLYPENGKTTSFAGYQITNLHEFFMFFVFMAGIASIILFFLSKKLKSLMDQ